MRAGSRCTIPEHPPVPCRRFVLPNGKSVLEIATINKKAPVISLIEQALEGLAS